MKGTLTKGEGVWPLEMCALVNLSIFNAGQKLYRTQYDSVPHANMPIISVYFPFTLMLIKCVDNIFDIFQSFLEILTNHATVLLKN